MTDRGTEEKNDGQEGGLKAGLDKLTQLDQLAKGFGAGDKTSILKRLELGRLQELQRNVKECRKKVGKDDASLSDCLVTQDKTTMMNLSMNVLTSVEKRELQDIKMQFLKYGALSMVTGLGTGLISTMLFKKIVNMSYLKKLIIFSGVFVSSVLFQMSPIIKDYNTKYMHLFTKYEPQIYQELDKSVVYKTELTETSRKKK